MAMVNDKTVVDKFEGLYYSPSELLSYGRLLNYVVGGRGIGKTYSWKKFCINQFKKNQKQFIWLRRFEGELKGFDRFFEKMKKEFPNDKLEVIKDNGIKFKINGDVAGYAFELSKWNTYKGDEFPNVYTIIFDEFLIEKSNYHYLPNEPEPLLNMIETILRTKDDPSCRCVCLANMVSVTGSYFTYFKIQADTRKTISIHKDGYILIEFPENEPFEQAKLNTRFGGLISGTPYADMSISNKSKIDNDTFIEKRSKKSEFMCLIYYNNMCMGVWRDANEGKIYMSEKYDPSARFKYVLQLQNMKPNMFYISNWKRETYLKMVVEAMKSGYLYYDNLTIKNSMVDLFSKMSI